MIILLPFSILSAAMFAEPSVTQIEEVIGLIHGTAADYQALYILLTDGRHPDRYFAFYSRKTVLASGPSVKRTGTATRRPLRTISTWRYLQPCVYPAIEINRLSLPPYRRR